MFSDAYSANNAITLEGGTGAGEIILENEHGVLQHSTIQTLLMIKLILSLI